LRQLRYHKQILNLLGIELDMLASRVALIEERERACGVRFPASVREWFAIESAEGLFYRKTNNDHLEELANLGDPRDLAQGYLKIATENQGVVIWYVRLGEGDDPPVYLVVDDYADYDDLAKTTQLESTTFTNFIFDMMSFHHFGGWLSYMHLSAEDRWPSPNELGLLRDWLQEGPRIETPDAMVYRFFNTQGMITIRAATPGHSAGATALWEIEADELEDLFEFAKKLWPVGTLSLTLKVKGGSPEWRAMGDEILQRLRA
jgi:hypothetical protein